MLPDWLKTSSRKGLSDRSKSRPEKSTSGRAIRSPEKEGRLLASGQIHRFLIDVGAVGFEQAQFDAQRYLVLIGKSQSHMGPDRLLNDHIES